MTSEMNQFIVDSLDYCIIGDFSFTILSGCIYLIITPQTAPVPMLSFVLLGIFEKTLEKIIVQKGCAQQEAIKPLLQMYGNKRNEVLLTLSSLKICLPQKLKFDIDQVKSLYGNIEFNDIIHKLVVNYSLEWKSK